MTGLEFDKHCPVPFFVLHQGRLGHRQRRFCAVDSRDDGDLNELAGVMVLAVGRDRDTYWDGSRLLVEYMMLLDDSAFVPISADTDLCRHADLYMVGLKGGQVRFHPEPAFIGDQEQAVARLDVLAT